MPSRKRGVTRPVYNPTAGDTQRRRIPVPRSDAAPAFRLALSFCELCWRRCELESALAAPPIYARMRSHLFSKIECTPATRVAALRHADNLAEQYAAALQGKTGPYALGRLLVDADITVNELRGNRSIDALRQRAYVKECQRLTAKAGNVLGALGSPGITDKKVAPDIGEKRMVKFSAQYCRRHNPRRSATARQQYQRDRRFQDAFEQAIYDISAEHAHEFRQWHSGDQAKLRKMAYERVRGTATIDLIRDLEKHGTVRRADIARKLGISRQAVYAAISAGAPKRKSRRPTH